MVKKKTNKMSFTLDMVVYPFDLCFSFGETDEEVIKFLKGKAVEKEDLELIKYEGSTCNGRCVMFDSGASIIRMPKTPATADEFGSLQHEITHYVMFLLFEKLHMPHNLDTTEAYCYLTGHITREVYKKLSKFK